MNKVISIMRCSVCGKEKYRYQFHRSCKICKECRHLYYLKNRRRIIRKSKLYERLRCRRDKKYAEERMRAKRIFFTRLTYYRANSFMSDLELYLFNINNVL